MASAKFLEDALSTNVDESTVNALVGSLENQLETSTSSSSSLNNVVDQSQNTNITSSGSSIIGVQKYVNQNCANELKNSTFACSSSNLSAPFSNVQGIVHSSYINATQSNVNNVSKGNDPVKVIYSQTSQSLVNPATSNRVNFPAQSLPNGNIGLGQNIVHTVPSSSLVTQNTNKTLAMQSPLVIKQGTTTGQVGLQPGIVTVPMTVNSSMSGSIPNVMTLNKPGGQNVVSSAPNMGVSAQSTIIPNVQILNMRPGTPGVTAPKSVATVSPRVVIGAPQVVGTRPAASGITLQTLQGLQPGQQGHLLLKTENGQYQLLRVGPAPAASTLTAPQAQTIRLSTVPAHPGVATVSTSVAAPAPPLMQTQQLPSTPVPAPAVAAPVAPPAPVQAPTVTTQKPSDNTKEKCRNFLANLLDLSSKEPKSVEMNVRNLIQELIDAQVEPEEFCDRLERLLNASPQPCLIGFLKKSLPLLRQSLVSKELVIEGIKPPTPHVAFTGVPAPSQATVVNTNLQNHQMNFQDGKGNITSSNLSTHMSPVVSMPSPSLVQSQQGNNFMISSSQIQPSQQILNNQSLYEGNGNSLSPTMTSLLKPQTQAQQMLNDQSVHDDSGSSSPILTTLMPPVIPVSLDPSSLVAGKNNYIMFDEQHQQKPIQKQGGIAVLQNIPIQAQPLKINKVSSPKSSVVNKGGFNRSPVPNSSLTTVLTPSKSLLKEKEKKMSSQFQSQQFADDKMGGDDDINDVAAMGGVNLAEESQRILGSTELIGTQIRSCKDEYFVPLSVMQTRLKAAAAAHGLEEPSSDVTSLFSHAVHEHLKNIVEKLAVTAQHRIDLVTKTDPKYEVTQDVKSQMKFLEELDRVEKKRREDSEREMLLRAAKSRSKNEDPEQAKLKAKAKEMQRAELEELRQREANLTALQAIGPRKKARLESPGAGGDSVSHGNSHNTSGLTGRSQMALRTRLKRINQRDVVFLLEQERETAHSIMLYRSYLK